MTMKLILIVILVVSVLAHPGQYRITVDSSNSYAPIGLYFERSGCPQSKCDYGLNTELFYLMEESYELFLKQSFNTEWLNVADVICQANFIATQHDVLNINAGRIFHFSPYCNDTNNTDKNICKYTKLMRPLLSEFPSEVTRITDKQRDSLIIVMETLFNMQMYDHSEAIGYLLLHKYLKEVVEYHIGLQSKAFVVHIDLTLYERIIRIATVISEVTKAKGKMASAAVYMMLITHCYETIAKLNLSHTPEDAFIHHIVNFRLIVAVPSMSVDVLSMKKYRAKMLERIDEWLQIVKLEHVNIPLWKFQQILPLVNFHMAHQGLNDRDIQLAYAKAFSTLCPELYYISTNLDSTKLIDSITVLDNSHDPPYLLKIAFLSAHFYDHSIGRILIDMFLLMRNMQLRIDGRLYSIQIIIYYVDRKTTVDYSTGSTRLRVDESNDDTIIENFKKYFGPNFRRLPHEIELIRELLGREKLDFLFYADVGMEYTTYLLAYSRLAVYQGVWWGHPITTGMNSIDYFISIDDEILEADTHYSEQLVRLNSINTVPLSKANKTEALLSLDFNQLPPGLTSTSKIGLVIGRLFKIHHDFIEIIVNILQSIQLESDMFIVFIAEKNLLYAGDVLQQIKNRLNAVATSEVEVVRCMEKVKFIHYNFYFGLLSMTRAVLDTYPYGGCLSAQDALVNGAPLVTLPSEFIRGRFTRSLYHQMGHTDLIANNATEFHDLVLKLLHNDTFYEEQTTAILDGFDSSIHQSGKVAYDWIAFIIQLFQ